MELVEINKNKFLYEDISGGKNKIKLNLGLILFEVMFGIVFKDKVVIKYVVKDSNFIIKISLDNKFDDINKINDKIFVK